MSEIKSEKALSFIREHILIQRDGSKRVMHYIAESAVGIAETEADQRHAKEVQELKNKAAEAFASVCKSNLGNDCERCVHGITGDYCRVLEKFTEKLNQQ